MQHDQYALSIISNIIDGHMSIKRMAPCPDVLKYSYILNTYCETANKARFLRRPALESLKKEWDPEMGIAGSIFEPHPLNFGKSYIFWRSTNDITTIFGNIHYYKSWEKGTQPRRPGVEESLP